MTVHGSQIPGMEVVLRQLPAAVIVVEAPSGRVLLLNRRAEETFGQARVASLEELHRDLELLDPDGRPLAYEQWPLVRCITSGERVAAECGCRRSDGTRLVLHCTCSPVHDEEGRLVAGVAVVEDVTETRRAEERLVEIVQKSSDFIGMASLDGEVGFVNEAGQRMVGIHGLDAARQTRVLDYFAPQDRPFVRDELLPAVIRDGRWPGERALHFRHFETGALIPVHWDAFRVDDPRTREPIGLATVTRDQSERRRTEATLRDAIRRSETILESITDDFVAVDREWRFTYLNARALDRFRQEAGEPLERDGLIGRIAWDVFPELAGSTFQREVERAGREQRTVVFEASFPRSGGWLEVHAYPSAAGVSIYSRDIAERRQRAEQQAGVAALGLKALAGDGLQPVLDDAACLVRRTLGVELVKVSELLPGGNDVVTRAGVGWQPGVLGSETEPAGRDSQAGYALLSAEPVISEDLAAEQRFAVGRSVRDHGAVSAAAVVIGGRHEPFGVLCACSLAPRSFSENDVHFLQAVANVLAAAAERSQADRRLHDAREGERRRIARDLHDEALGDLNLALAEAHRGAREATDPQGPLTRLVPALKRVGLQLRGAIYDLRLSEEEHRPLGELLEALVTLHRTMAEDLSIDLDLRESLPSGPAGPRGTELVRIVGEALTNIRRHAGAARVRVGARVSDQALCVEVTDDGCGFEVERVPRAPESTGIRGMRERAAAVRGELTISSAPGEGTRVRFVMPLAPETAPAAELVRVLLVEDHTAVRQAIAMAFEREPGFAIAGQAASLQEARRMLGGVDVAVVDLGLPDGYGGDLIKELRAVNPQAQALVLSASLDRSEIARAVERGAAGVLDKTVYLDEVVRSVRRLRAGETLLPLDEVVELLRFATREREREHEDRQAIARLTRRELEVLQLLAEGLDSQGVASRLHVTIRTERNHIANILAKLGVHSQLQALVFALRYRLVELR